jgi:hypothetical protein
MAIGNIGSSGLNDWLAVASWGAAMRANTSDNTINSVRSQKSNSNAANSDVDPFSPEALRTKIAKTRAVSQSVRTEQLQQKQRVQQNTSVENNIPAANDLLSQLYALYQSPQTLADIQPVRINISSYDMAKMQEERDDPELGNPSRYARNLNETLQDADADSEMDEQTYVEDDTSPFSSSNNMSDIMDGYIQAAYASYHSATNVALPPIHTLIG